MKRDWEVIRAILVTAEEKPPGAHLYNNEVDGYDPQIVAAHMDMLHDAGYIEAKFVRSNNLTAILIKTTYEGHDLLDTIRSESTWVKIKSVAKSKGLELTFEAVKQVGKYVIEKTVKGEPIPGLS